MSHYICRFSHFPSISAYFYFLDFVPELLDANTPVSAEPRHFHCTVIFIFNGLCFDVYFIWYQYSYTNFLLISISLKYNFPVHCLLQPSVWHMFLINWAAWGFVDFIQSDHICLLTEWSSLFTFIVITGMPISNYHVVYYSCSSVSLFFQDGNGVKSFFLPLHVCFE